MAPLLGRKVVDNIRPVGWATGTSARSRPDCPACHVPVRKDERRGLATQAQVDKLNPSRAFASS